MSVKIPEAQISYPFVAKENRNGKYSASFVFAPGTDLTELKRAAIQVAIDKFGEKEAIKKIKAGQIKLEGGPHHTFRLDGESKGYPEGSVFINATSLKKPGVVSIYPDPNNGGRPLPIANVEEELYPGAFVIATVNPYWYEKDGNKGVAWGLNNIQKRRDGERLDGKANAEDEFDADPGATADLDSITGESEEKVPAGAGASSSASALEALLK